MINHIILFFILSLPFIVQPEIRTPIYILYFFSILVLTKKKYISKNILLLISPIFLILLVGLLHTPLYSIYDISLEAFRFIGIIACYLVGYAIYRKNHSVEYLLKILIFVSILICGKFIFDFISNLSMINILSFNEWKKSIRGNGMMASIGIVLIIKVLLMKIKLFKFQKLILPIGLLLCTTSLILSMSRIAIISFLIIFAIMFNIHKKIPKIIILTLIIFILLLVLFILPVNIGIDFNNIPLVYHFIEKLQNPLIELGLKSYNSMIQIGQHWRGYESYRSWIQYRDGNLLSYLLGSGFGSKIDIGITMLLNRQSYTEILVTHNGYLYLLVKTGLIGLLSYLAFISMSLFTTYKIYKSTNDQLIKLLSKLSFALILTVALSTFVVSGFINKSNFSIVLILLGYIAAYKINTKSYYSPVI